MISAAIEVFTPNGFSGTATRDMAAHSEVNEAIIFYSLSHRVQKTPDSAAGQN